MKKYNCIICNKEFFSHSCYEKRGINRNKFCSIKCRASLMIGKPGRMTGHRHSEKTKKRFSDYLKEQWKLGLRDSCKPKVIVASKKCLYCGNIINKKKGNYNFWIQKYCSMKCKGLAKRKLLPKCELCGKERTAKSKRFCRSCFRIYYRGDKIWSWRGGLTPISNRLRMSEKYIQWRTLIFQRDDYTCKLCNVKGNKLQVDHYPKMFSEWLRELKEKYGKDNLYETALNHKPLWESDIGRTLCLDCHKKTNTYLKGIKFKKGQKSWNAGTKGLQIAWNKGFKGWTKKYPNAGFQKGHPLFGKRLELIN